MKAKRNYLLKNLILMTFITLSFKSNAQNLDFDKPCYCVNETVGNPNYLYEFTDTITGWQKIGDEIISGGSIEAMALNPVANKIYVSKHRELGTIEINNGARFKPIGYINKGVAINGELGKIYIDDLEITGLSYNPYTKILWASHKTGHLDIQNKIEDIIFKINPETAEIITGEFENGNDYSLIQSVNHNNGELELYDVEDIAINPYTNQLYVIHNQGDNAHNWRAITQNNTYTGLVENWFMHGELGDVRGLGFSKYGQIFGTLSQSNSSSWRLFDNNNTFIHINNIDLSLPKSSRNFEAFDCMNGINDLALSISIKPFTPPLNVGDKVYLEYTIHNQGEIICDEVDLAFNYSNELSGPKAYALASVLAPINPGESVTRSVLLPFSVEAVSSCANIYGEIVKSTYSGIANGKDGQKVYLPDIDSTPGNGMENGEDDEAMVSFNMLYSCNTDPCIGDVEVVNPNDACSCIVSEPQVSGCTDVSACNYNANANCDDDSCQPVPLCNTDACEGDVEIIDPNDACSCKVVESQIFGCTDASACNYNANANCDDDSCQPVPLCNTDACEGDVETIDPNDACSCKVIESQVSGCMDASACNFNANANCDDDSCQPVPICNTDACEGDVEIIDPNDACSCKVVEPQIFGCTDNTALNYSPTANCDDNSCYDADSYTAVWPGDADANGIVDNTDVLYIGLAEGKNGLSRENASNNWTNQMAVDWEGSVLDINNKHQDTNGDGTINAQDLQSVELNYNKSISNDNNGNQGEKVGVFKLYQTSIIGEIPVEYDLVLDTDEEVLIHGIKGSIDLSKYFTSDDNTVLINTATSVLKPELVFTNYDPITKIFEYALSRTDGQAIMVKKGDRLLKMGIAEELYDGGSQLKLKLKEAGIMNAFGELHRVGNSTLWSNTFNLPAANATLSFNIITTPYTCGTLGTAEIDILKNDESYFDFLWSNGINTFHTDNLLNGSYTVDVTHVLGIVADQITLNIDAIPETKEDIKLSSVLYNNGKYIANKTIELNNGLEISKDVTVEFLIDYCYD